MVNGIDRAKAAIGFVVVILAVVAGAAAGAGGCATLRLNGCHKLAACGPVAAYTCAEQLTCADDEGNTLRSEPLRTSRDPCRICRRGL